MAFQTMSGIPKVTSTANFYSNTNPLLQSRGIGGFAEPSALFGAGEQGAWWGFSDLSSMYQTYDATKGGITDAALEQPVAFVVDKRTPISGQDQIKNSDLTQGSTYWVLGPNTIISGKQFVATATPAFAYVANQPTALKANTWYYYQFTVNRISGNYAVGYNATQLVSGSTSNTFRGYFNTGAAANGLFNMIESAGGTFSGTLSDVHFYEAPGNHLIQATAGARPTLSRRYNLLTKTDQFSGAAWTKRGTAIAVPSAVVGPNGAACELISGIGAALTNDLYQIGTLAAPTGAATTNRIWIKKAVPGGAGVLQLINAGNQANGEWRVDFSKLSDNFELITAAHPAVTVVATFTIAGGAGAFLFSAFSGGPLSFYATQVDQRLTADANLAIPEYQRVDTASVYDTLGFPAYLLFDGATKWMQSASAIDFSATNKITLFAGITKLSDAAQGTVLEDNGLSFTISAPRGAGQTTYGGDLRNGANNVENLSSFPAPITNVISMVGDISTAASQAAQLSMLANNAAGIPAYTGAVVTVGNFVSGVHYVGARTGASLWFNGRLYGIISRGAATNDNDLSMTNKWMGSKCGLFF